MQKFIVKAVLILSFVIGYNFSYAQNSVANCPKKGTADCPLIKNCALKGTKDCPYTATALNVSKTEMKNCPLAGTPDCPLAKCPLKGTANCPLVKNNSKASFASNSKTEKEDNLPPCCKKSMK